MIYVAADLAGDDPIKEWAKELIILIEWRLWAEAQVDACDRA